MSRQLKRPLIFLAQFEHNNSRNFSFLLRLFIVRSANSLLVYSWNFSFNFSGQGHEHVIKLETNLIASRLHHYRFFLRFLLCLFNAITKFWLKNSFDSTLAVADFLTAPIAFPLSLTYRPIRYIFDGILIFVPIDFVVAVAVFHRTVAAVLQVDVLKRRVQAVCRRVWFRSFMRSLPWGHLWWRKLWEKSKQEKVTNENRKRDTAWFMIKTSENEAQKPRQLTS